MATPVANSVALTGNLDIDALVQGSSWQLAPDRTLTYSLDLEFDNLGEPVQPWTSDWQNAIANALAEWANVAKIHFVRIGTPDAQFQNQSTADISIALSPGSGQGVVAALALFPDPDFADQLLTLVGYSRNGGEFPFPRPEGDVSFDSAFVGFSNLHTGTLGFEIVMHELGHALGLKHPEDDGGNGRPTRPTAGGEALMTSQAAMDGIIVSTPMLLDIQAIQQIYGANMSYHGGDDVYQLKNDGSVRTLWDAGGIDTISAESFGLDGVTIDLRAGNSSVPSGPSGGMPPTLAIAYNVTIENAIGSASNDRIIGNAANNLLDGGLGNDTMSGGPGDDVYVIDQLNSGGDVVAENPMEGSDEVRSWVSYTLGWNIENLTLLGNNAVRGTGNELANVIAGNSIGNLIDGGSGADTMSGAAGDDTYLVDDPGDVVTENPAEGADEVRTSTNYALGANIETLTLLGNTAFRGAGNALPNVINGTDLPNLLDGGAGADTMTGGNGDDTYVVDQAGDVVTEAASAGTDTIRAAVNYTLSGNLEILLLSGSANLQGNGNALDNVLIGNGGNNLLDGGVGADTLIGGGGNDIYIIDNPGDATVESDLSTELVSTAADGTQANGFSSAAVISGNGRYLAFASYGTNLSGGTYGTQNIYVKDLQSGSVSLASGSSSGTVGNSSANEPHLSADGRYVVFTSSADNLVPGDSNAMQDVFVKDVQTGQLTRISTSSAGTQGNSFAGNADISGDGRYAAFSSFADNLVAGDSNHAADVFVRDLQIGTTTLVSTNASGAQGNGSSWNGAVCLSAGGRYVVFRSDATNLVAADTNGAGDIFRKDLLTGQTLLVSSSSDGTPANADAANHDIFLLNGSTPGGVSADGRYVAFTSLATNLVPGDTNSQGDIFVKDLQTGLTTRVSTASDGTQASNGSNGCNISADGRYVVFASVASNLAAGDSSENFDVFVKDLLTGDTVWISAAPGNQPANSISGGGSLSADGRNAVFYSGASNLVTGDVNGSFDIFLARNPLIDPGGNDEVRSSVNYKLGAYLENLVLSGSSALSGSGNMLANALRGNAADNLLTGGAGNDTLDGGAGNDTAIFPVTRSQASWSTAAGVTTVTSSEGIDQLTSIEYLRFSDQTVYANNAAPAGGVVIAGTPLQGQMLSINSTLSDADGLGAITYQWQSSSNGGGTWTNLPAGATLTLGQAQVGKLIRATASYTDGHGTLESVTGDPAGPIGNVNDVPVTRPFGNRYAGINEAVALRLGTLFTDLDSDALSFTANGLPPELSINTVTGLVTGTTAGTPAVHHITVTGTDASNTSASVSFDLSVIVGNTVAAQVLTRGGLALPGVTAHELLSASPAGGLYTFKNMALDTNAASGLKTLVADLFAEGLGTEQQSAFSLQGVSGALLQGFQLTGAVNAANGWTVTETHPAGGYALSASHDSSTLGTDALIGRLTLSLPADSANSVLDLSSAKLGNQTSTARSLSYLQTDIGDSGLLNSTLPEGSVAIAFGRSTADYLVNGTTKPVTAADALDALKLSVGLAASKGSSWKELIAADINHDGRVTAADALEILKVSVGVNTVQPSWVFVPEDTGINPGLATMTKTSVAWKDEISLSAVIEPTSATVTGILVGDVNNSWVIPH